MNQSERNKLTWQNPETRRKRCGGISRARKGKHCSNGFKKGNISWNKGLTKETDKRLLEVSLQAKGRKMNPKVKLNCSIAQQKRDRSTFNISGFLKGWKLNRKGSNNGRWQGGIQYEPYAFNWTETLKRAIRERDNYICQLCFDYGEQVHHIDYNKKNCNLDNLITLCRKCHSKTNSKRSYWNKYLKNLLKLRGSN